ncbi:MAG: hypothetical protein IJB97_05110, partial [Clostridia bacterium]|nr:hypothetical protein [Clostridia bacterium]
MKKTTPTQYENYPARVGTNPLAFAIIILLILLANIRNERSFGKMKTKSRNLIVVFLMVFAFVCGVFAITP